MKITEIKKQIFASTLAAALSCTAAMGATLQTSVDTFVFGSEGLVIESYEDDALSVNTPFINLNAADNSGGTAVSGEVSANAETGELKLQASSAGTRNNPDGSTASFGTIDSRVSITEFYQVTGTGKMTVSMLLNGSWNFTTPEFSLRPLPDWFFGASVFVGPSGGESTTVCLGTDCTPSIDQSSAGSLNNFLIEATLDLDTRGRTQSIRVFSDLYAQLNFANGSLDFSNTGKMFVSFGDGLSGTPTDPDFLSNPAFLEGSTPVPLPSGIWLMLSGLGAVGGLTWRRKTHVVSRVVYAP